MNIAAVTGLTITDAHRRQLLDGVDLELRAGQVTGLVGESGAGKTTLAHALVGRLGPGLRLTCGRVRVAGHDPFTPAGQRALRGRVTAYLPQDPAGALDPARTVAGQLRTAARIAHPSASRHARAALIEDAAAAASFEHALLSRRPASLSGGQAQRALLAWTFLIRPGLLVLDEPTSGLDPDTALRVSTTFAALPWGPALLLISHDRQLVDRVSDRILHLHGGRLRAVEPVEPLATPAATRPGAYGPPRDPVLSMAGVTIRRGGRTLLHDAALRLGTGELLAVRGPSGAGKTSLARALCGLAPPATGVLRWRGADVPWLAAARTRGGGPYLAYVGQDARAALNPRETVCRTLQRALDTARRHDRPAPAGPDIALDQVGLPPSVLDRCADQLSGGQRHRVALARAVAAGPAVLVCDETTAALDHAGAQRILDALDTLRHETGLPVLLITHQDSVADRADRVLTLEEGRLA